MAHATAAKAGIDALTRTLAVEWAPWRIRVNAVAPGPIPTPGVIKAFSAPRPQSAEANSTAGKEAPAGALFSVEDAMAEYARKKIPLGRWGAPRDIANAVAFLASPAGDWITGSILVVDGGEWLHR